MTIRTVWPVLLVVFGCGQPPAQSSRQNHSAPIASDYMATSQEAVNSLVRRSSSAGRSSTDPPTSPQDIGIERKIIYTATIDIIVRDLDVARTQLLELARLNQAYVSNSDIASNTGAQRLGRWSFRVPVDRYSTFTQSVLELGNVQLNKSDARDVTDEYTDLEARIKSKQILEQRLADIAKAKTEKVADLLEVERELNRVRGEIEQAQGRRQMIQQLTTLSTVSITLREIKDYVPPSAPTFAATIKATFIESIGAIVSFGKFATLVVVAVAPWTPLIALGIAPLWIWRWRGRNRTSTPAPDSQLIV